jgi:hypothetical protein
MAVKRFFLIIRLDIVENGRIKAGLVFDVLPLTYYD